LARFSTRKTVRQFTTIYQQSTTTSPQKTITKNAFFSKYPVKQPLDQPKKIIANLSLAPFQFGTKHAEEAVRTMPNKTNTGVRAPAVDIIGKLQLNRLLTVYRKVYLIGNANDMHADS
jgi:hypothetical protein